MSNTSLIHYWRESAKSYIVNGSVFDNLTIVNKGLLVVCLPLLFQLVFAGMMFSMLTQAELSLSAERRSVAMVAAVQQVSSEVLDTVKFHSLALTADSLDTYRDAKLRAQQTRLRMQALRELAAQDPLQQKNIADLGTTVTQILHMCDSLTALSSAQRTTTSAVGDEPTIILKQVEHNLAAINQKAEKIIDVERNRSRQLAVQEMHYRANLRVVLVTGIAADVLISVALAIFFMRAISSRITRLKANTERFARAEPPLQTFAGNDELGDLDRAFEKMANSIARNFRKEKAILNNSSDVICSLNSELQFLEVSKASEREWGFSRDSLVGRTLLDLIKEEQHDRVGQFFVQALDGKPGQRVDLQLLQGDGSYRTSSWALTWSREEGLFYTVARDITAQQDLENARLEFMRMVSHDIRAPLTSLSMLLESLNNGVYGSISQNGMRMIENCASGTQRIIRLVTQLLDLEKFEAGQLQLMLDKIDLCELIESILELQPLASEKNVHIEVQVAPQAEELQITVDRDRISQVLINLVSNAIRYSPVNSRILVTADIADGMVEISVADQGPGIPAKSQAVIFERFQQLPDSAGLHKEGTGLGLNIARAIVESHGGVINVESEVRHGTKFTVALPLLPVSSENSEAMNPKANSHSP
jgi:PAS domain S-box-containing protein